MAANRGGGGSGGSPKGGGAQQATPSAPPVTFWDRLAAAAAAKTPAERTNLIGAVVSETAQTGDLNQLIAVLRDTRPQAQIGTICALIDPDLYGLYANDPASRGAIASSISPLLASADMSVQLTAAATVQFLLEGMMDDESIRLIREDISKARANAGMALAIILSFAEDKLP